MHDQLFSLAGRNALVTGGNRGIGAAIAGQLVAAGASVMLAARDEAALRQVATDLQAPAPGTVHWRATDMTDRTDVDALASDAIARLGSVDILINNAGTNIPQSLVDIQDADWDRLIELNLTSCLRLARTLAAPMAQRGWGRIIHIASIMGSVGAAGRSGYCASKAALIGMSHAQAIELGPRGVTVNCVSPGPILTDLPRRALSDDQRASFAEATALGRWGETQEIAGPVLMLASDAGSYITGANLTIDGGVTIKAF